jgi:hypothetical protein
MQRPRTSARVGPMTIAAMMPGEREDEDWVVVLVLELARGGAVDVDVAADFGPELDAVAVCEPDFALLLELASSGSTNEAAIRHLTCASV